MLTGRAYRLRSLGCCLCLSLLLGCVHREPPQRATSGQSTSASLPTVAPRKATSGVETAASSIASGPALPSGASRPDVNHQGEGEPETTRPFREVLGLNVKFTQGQPLTDLPTLEELGVRWVRDTVDWATLEPQPGQFVALPAAFLQRIAYYRAHHIGIVFLLAYENRAAYPATRDNPLRPIDPIAFGRYAKVVAERLRGLGVEFVLEIWNEPHNFVIRPMLSGGWNGKPPAPWLLHYLRMAKSAVEQVKAIDPRIKLLSDDDMWIIHYWYLEAGLPNQLDGFAFHPYTLAGPERAAVSKDTDWIRPFAVVDDEGSFESAVHRLREHGRKKLGKSPEMWITEWGWPLGQSTPFGPVTEELLAAWLPRAFVVAAAAGVRTVCWFSARDSVDGPMGLMDNDGHKRKPYYSLQVLSRQLGDWVWVKHLWGAKHLTSGLQAFLFTNGDQQQKLVLWNAERQARAVPLIGPSSNAAVIGADGQPIAPKLDARGRRSIEVGNAPVYVAPVQFAGNEAEPE